MAVRFERFSEVLAGKSYTPSWFDDVGAPLVLSVGVFPSIAYGHSGQWAWFTFDLGNNGSPFCQLSTAPSFIQFTLPPEINNPTTLGGVGNVGDAMSLCYVGGVIDLLLIQITPGYSRCTLQRVNPATRAFINFSANVDSVITGGTWYTV